MNADVSIMPCPDYAPETCRTALEAVLGPIDGLSWVRPGMKVGIKANLVAAMAPEKAATTHPNLLSALARLLLEAGAGEVIIGDSPGGLYTQAALERVYKATGLLSCEGEGIRLNRDFGQTERHCPEAKAAKSVTLTSWLLDCDAVVNFCKLKSHGMMGLSAAAKNLFGTIPGTMKPEYHFRYPKAEDFSDMIVDLDQLWHPVLNLVDGVLAMEGNGPTAGTPVHMGLVGASADPHKLDLVCAALVGMEPEGIPTLKAAMERGLCPGSVEALTVAGDWKALAKPEFQGVRSKKSLQFRSLGGKFLGPVVSRVAGAALETRPQVDKKLCIGCGKCRNICPAHAITMERKLPVIRRSACIHCFCCQEFCPKGAMQVHRTAVARLLTHGKK